MHATSVVSFCCVGHHQDDVVLIIKLLRAAPEALHVVVVLLSHLHNIMSPTPFSLSSPHCIEQNLCVPRLLIVSIVFVTEGSLGQGGLVALLTWSA